MTSNVVEPTPTNKGLFGWITKTDTTSIKAVQVDKGAGALALWSARVLLIVAFGWVLWQLVAAAWVIVFPAVLGLMVGTLLEPVARFLRPKLGPSGAAGATVLGAVAAISGGIALLAPQVAGQIGPLAVKVSQGVGKLREIAAGKPFYIRESDIGEAIDNGIQKAQEHALSISGGVLNGVVSLGSVVLNLLLLLVICFYVLKDGPKFLPWLCAITGPTSQKHVTQVGGQLWAGLAGFVRAQALVGVVDAVAIGIALAILDVPLAVPLAVLVFFGSFIPIFGAVIAGVIAALVALVAGGPITALIVLIVVAVVNQVEGNLLAPLLLGKSLSLHPLIIMGSVTVGTSISGITGAFLAVPFAATIAILFRYITTQLGTEPAAVEEVDPVDPEITVFSE